MAASTSTTALHQQTPRKHSPAFSREDVTLVVRCNACDGESFLQGPRPWIDVPCDACDRGEQHVLVHPRDIDDQHLPLLAPDDRRRALEAIARAGEAEWARAACLALARERLSAAAQHLRRRDLSGRDMAAAVDTLAEASEWHSIAHACRRWGVS